MRKTCLETIHSLSKINDSVLFIGSDLGPGVLNEMKLEFPNRFLMEGISEQHIIGMSAGLAMDGYMPYVNTIATFLTRRCFEQILVDICLHELPVRLIGNGGGLVYAPLGPTHQSIEDIAILRSLPNMTIIAPCDAIEMKNIMIETLKWPHPVYIRIAKGGDKIISKKNQVFKIGKSIIKKKTEKILLISTGIMTQIAIDVAEQLTKEGYPAGVIHMHTIKPLDTEILISEIPKTNFVFTLEEHILDNGFGTSILEFCSDNLPDQLSKISRIGLLNNFQKNYGNQSELLKFNGLNQEEIYKKIKNKVNK